MDDPRETFEHETPRRFPLWLLVVLALVLMAGLLAASLLRGGVFGIARVTPTAAIAATTPTPRPSATASPSLTPSPTRTPTATPTPTPTPIVVITGINALGRLETAQFVMQTIVDLENEPDNFWQQLAGPDTLLLVAEGEVVAGFDMQRVAPADIIVHGTAVTLTLPPPAILYSRVDNERTYVYERRTGILRPPDPSLESEARRLAEKRLTGWALERGILAQANRFGVVYLEGFLRSLGLREIVIQVRGE